MLSWRYWLQTRPLNSLILLGCLLLLAIALGLEHGLGLLPCNLCILQRIAFAAIGMTALLALLHNPARVGRKMYGLLMLIFADLGIALAGRQIWLQHLPPEQVPACLPTIDYLVKVMPLNDVLLLALKGDGNCAEVTWRLLGLSIADWSLLAFVLFCGLALVQLLRR